MGEEMTTPETLTIEENILLLKLIIGKAIIEAGGGDDASAGRADKPEDKSRRDNLFRYAGTMVRIIRFFNITRKINLDFVNELLAILEINSVLSTANKRLANFGRAWGQRPGGPQEARNFDLGDDIPDKGKLN